MAHASSGLVALLLALGGASGYAPERRSHVTGAGRRPCGFVPIGAGGSMRGVSGVGGAYHARQQQQPRVGEWGGRPSSRDRTGVRGRVMVMQSKDYYELLGVSKSATKQDIKKAYRKLALKWHPDVCKEPDAAERFKEINKAYEALHDDEKRARYDRFGEAGVEGRGFGGGPSFVTEDFDIGDIFDSFFGGSGMGGGGGARGARGRGRRAPTMVPGDDLRLDLTVPFTTSVFGGEEKVRISHLETCKACDGKGGKKGSPSRVCGKCQGNGVVFVTQRTAFGIMQTQTVCPECEGSGEVIAEKCNECRGQGSIQNNKQIKIDIPAGVQDGTKLRIKGEGDAGQRGGPPGDLYVFLTVESDKYFRREGIDLFSDLTVDYLDAILGTKKAVRTVDGDVDVEIAAGTQPNTKIRLSGKGVPRLGQPSFRGDQIINVAVDFPTKLNAKERELLERLKDLQSGGSGEVSKSSSSAAASTEEGGRKKDKASTSEGGKKDKKGGFFGFGGGSNGSK